MIRRAALQDATEICDIWNWMIRETLSTFTTLEKTVADISALIDAREEAFFVAEVGGQCLGFVTFGPFRSGPGYAATVEHSIVVSPSAQGKGIGEALMQTAILAAQQQNKHVMVAAISGANSGAIRFHEALGFEIVGRMPQVGRKRGEWLDLVLMQKNLSATV